MAAMLHRPQYVNNYNMIRTHQSTTKQYAYFQAMLKFNWPYLGCRQNIAEKK